MSCAEVMYQPYSPYFPYHHQRAGPSATDHYRKFVKPHTEVSASPSSSLIDPSTPSPTPVAAEAKEKERGVEAQYLSANCVLFTYYSGDISSVVDEHFARALSQAYPSATSTETKAHQAKDGPPMSHRNFPPSFWNSNYQPMSSHTTTSSSGLPDLTYGTDPYHHHPGSLHATLHHQNDPWATHYSLTGQPGGFPHPHSYHHPGMSAASPRFAPNYPSLLLQPTVRSSRLGPSAACSSLEKSESWSASRYHHDPIMDPNYGAAYGAMAPMPDATSTGYMSMYEVIQNMQRSYR